MATMAPSCSWAADAAKVDAYFKKEVSCKGYGRGKPDPAFNGPPKVLDEKDLHFWYACDLCMKASGGADYGGRIDYAMDFDPEQQRQQPWFDSEITGAVNYIREYLSEESDIEFGIAAQAMSRGWQAVLHHLMVQNSADPDFVELCLQTSIVFCRVVSHKGLFRTSGIRKFCEDMKEPTTTAEEVIKILK